jgi:putative addiction module killer protein
MESEFEIIAFEDENQVEPFTQWLLSLDSTFKKRILIRLTRLQVGNFGDCKRIDADIFELRCFFGPGYRIYFGKEKKAYYHFVVWWG